MQQPPLEETPQQKRPLIKGKPASKPQNRTYQSTSPYSVRLGNRTYRAGGETVTISKIDTYGAKCLSPYSDTYRPYRAKEDWCHVFL